MKLGTVLSYYEYSSERGLGWQFGGRYYQPLDKVQGISIGLTYIAKNVKMNCKVKSTEQVMVSDISTAWVEMPILYHYNICEQFGMFGGVYMASKTYDRVRSAAYSGGYPAYDGNLSSLNGIDTGFKLGGVFNIDAKQAVNFEYSIGMVDLYDQSGIESNNSGFVVNYEYKL